MEQNPNKEEMQKDIQDAIDEIRVHNPELADHLKHSIKITGNDFSYCPNEDISWKTQ